jgi:hypothetical protein
MLNFLKNAVIIGMISKRLENLVTFLKVIPKFMTVNAKNTADVVQITTDLIEDQKDRLNSVILKWIPVLEAAKKAWEESKDDLQIIGKDFMDRASILDRTPIEESLEELTTATKELFK